MDISMLVNHNMGNTLFFKQKNTLQNLLGSHNKKIHKDDVLDQVMGILRKILKDS